MTVHNKILFAILILGVAVFVLRNDILEESGMEYLVILKEDGFHPKELVIQKGASVIFTSDREFWPASQPHPQHTIYPEFDSKQLIEPNEKWKFKFNDLGTWAYHDHIKHGHAGWIKVVEKVDAKSLVVSAKEDCLKALQSEKLVCWEDKLENVLMSAGLDTAFDAFKSIYNTEPEVPKSCHGWGHILGEAAYELYESGNKMSFRQEMGYCGYGFFHGFIETVMSDTGDVSVARQWCDSLAAEKEKQALVHSNCMHGIGHGTTAWLLENRRNWGNFQRTASLGLEFCEEILVSQDDLQDCYDGVFNELKSDVFEGQYGMSDQELLAKSDPLWYCKMQQDRHKESCYFEFVGIFYQWFNSDLIGAMKFALDNIEDLPSKGPRIVAKIAADFMESDIIKSEYKKNVEACRKIYDYLFEPCFFGIVNGFIQHGEPENMHVRALAFCTADYLTDEEKNKCHGKLVAYLKFFYSADKIREVCGTFDRKYEAYCKAV